MSDLKIATPDEDVGPPAPQVDAPQVDADLGIVSKTLFEDVFGRQVEMLCPLDASPPLFRGFAVCQHGQHSFSLRFGLKGPGIKEAYASFNEALEKARREALEVINKPQIARASAIPPPVNRRG